jgi:predicted RNA-binding Zn-ribbon protein involved in translation (DUF1610 family)
MYMKGTGNIARQTENVQRRDYNMKCPRCGVNELLEEGCNALSRQDNETEICNDCGTDEALAELF